MSVAIIVDTFPRWSERFIARELNELARRGVAFSIYCLKAGDASCESDAEFSGLIERRVVLPACFVPSAARELGMDAAARARKKRVEKELGLTAFRQIGCANSLVKLIREHGHSIVYAHFASLPSTLGWLAAVALELPLVVSAHARDVFVEAQLLSEKMKCARRFFTCQSRAFFYLRETIEGLDPWVPSDERDDAPSGKTVLMRHGLPLQAYPFQPRKERVAREFKLLAAGRFVRKKGFHDLIDALDGVELEKAPVSLTLLGEGPEAKALSKRVAKLKLGAHVTMPGSVQGAELRKYFDEADALVVPSVAARDGDSDGVPNVVLEAMALGVPVIGTQAGSLGDVLREEGCDPTGVIFAPGDVTGLARAIRWVMKEQIAVSARVANARKMIESQFDVRRTIEPLARELA
ncbi:MAG TPA: glycosyltransferase family 4 protein [Planctomycetota bacterium]|nr:glycosyltransferase family 4 protein [Planctomycetota bacterium]